MVSVGVQVSACLCAALSTFHVGLCPVLACLPGSVLTCECVSGDTDMPVSLFIQLQVQVDKKVGTVGLTPQESPPGKREIHISPGVSAGSCVYTRLSMCAHTHTPPSCPGPETLSFLKSPKFWTPDREFGDIDIPVASGSPLSLRMLQGPGVGVGGPSSVTACCS